jgi:hypothetical protein
MILETLIKNFTLPAIKDMISAIHQIMVYVENKDPDVKNEAIDALIEFLTQFKEKD